MFFFVLCQYQNKLQYKLNPLLLSRALSTRPLHLALAIRVGLGQQ